MPRFDRLEGIGRVRVYDNGGKTLDRYLVLFEDMPSVDHSGLRSVDKPLPYGPRAALGMSPNPTHPQGVSMWGDESPPNTWGTGRDTPRWRRIPFASLPENVQQHVIDRAKES